jgi:hypothetical protein
MPVPKNKAALLAAIDGNYQKLRLELASISPALTRAKNMPGHRKDTRMSVSNLVAYVIGWSKLAYSEIPA